MTWHDNPDMVLPADFGSPLEAMLAGWVIAAVRQFAQEQFPEINGRFISATEVELEWQGEVVVVKVQTRHRADHTAEYNEAVERAIETIGEVSAPPAEAKDNGA